MLDVCGSVAVLVSLRTIFPVAASARYRSVENRLRVERNAIHCPSGTDRRSDVELLANSLASDHPLADVIGPAGIREHVAVGPLDGGMPLGRELL